MEYYFAYGSNLSIKQMRDRDCEILGEPIKGALEGYCLGFTVSSISWSGGVADVIKSSNDSVKGALYTVKDIKPMDRHEGCKCGDEKRSKYYRKLLPIQTDKGELKAWVYYVVKREADFVQPSLRYVNQMINGQGNNDGGLRGLGFSEDIIKEVCQIAKIDYNKL